MIVPLGYVTTLPAARNAPTCAEASGVRIISRKSWPMVSTDAPRDDSSMNGTRFREILNIDAHKSREHKKFLNVGGNEARPCHRPNAGLSLYSSMGSAFVFMPSTVAPANARLGA